MAGLKHAVETLINDRSKQVDFFVAPESTLQAIGSQLSLPEQAVLYSMDRGDLYSATQLPAVESLHFRSGWPADYADWDLTRSALAPGFTNPVSSGGFPLAVMALQGGTGGVGGWTDPHPHGRGIRPESAGSGSSFVLTILGEGFMDGATVSFFTPDEFKKANGKAAAIVANARLLRTAAGEVYGTFRTRYLQLVVPSLSAGRYVVGIDNLRDPSPKSGDIKLTAGQVLDVQ